MVIRVYYNVSTSTLLIQGNIFGRPNGATTMPIYGTYVSSLNSVLATSNIGRTLTTEASPIINLVGAIAVNNTFILNFSDTFYLWTVTVIVVTVSPYTFSVSVVQT
jgi:hypothetical protein